MRKNSLKYSDFYTCIAVSGLWVYCHADILKKIDETFLSLFGKNLTGRNVLVQIIVLGGLFLLSVFLPILLERLITRNQKFSHLADALILLILAVPAAQLLVICANQVLRRDDYWEIADARKYGFPGSMFHEIRQWNGRYTGWGLRSLHAVLPSIPYIDIFLALNIILLTTGTSMLAFRMLKFQKTDKINLNKIRIQSILIGFGLSLSFILMSANTWEFWFWGSGTMIYGFGISLCVVSIALILNAADEDKFTFSKMILPIITCFLTCGCSELCTASLAAFVFFILIWKRTTTKRWNRQILFFLCELCILFAAIFLMSGSLDYAANRAHLEADEQSGVLAHFIDWLPGMINWAFEGLHAFTFIKSRELTIFLLSAFLIGTRLQFDKKAAKKLIIIALWLTVVAHCVLLINSLLDYMPPRVITVGICWFVSAMAIACMLLGSLVTLKKERWHGQIKSIFCALLLLLVMNHFYRENIETIRNIRGSWNIRNTLLMQRQNGGEAVKTCSLPSPGSSQDDILKAPEEEFNIAAALYYQIPEITADHRCPPWGELFLPEDIYNRH